MLTLIVAASTVDAGHLVREFKGTGNTTTAEFSVEAPWIIDWRLDSDYENRIALDMVLVDAKTGNFIGGIKSGTRNNIRLAATVCDCLTLVVATRFVSVPSLARWSIKVQQLTKEEAELYTPARAN